MRKLITFILTLTFISILLTSCANSTSKDTLNENNADDKPVIYTTFYALEYITKELVGDNIDVYGLTSSGGDIHSYEPTMKDMENINKADMFIYLSDEVEVSAKNISNSVNKNDVDVLQVIEYLNNDDLEMLEEKIHEHEETEGHAHEEDEKETDADGHDHSNLHLWILPTKNIEIASVIRDELIKKYPDMEKEINENYKTLATNLLEVDKKYEEELKNTRIDEVVVSHDAYQYLVKYGVYTIPVKDESASKDPTQKELNAIIEEIKELNIEYVLYDQNIPCVPLDTISDETGVQKETIYNLTVLPNDDRENGLTLIDLFYKNLEVLKKAMN